MKDEKNKSLMNLRNTVLELRAANENLQDQLSILDSSLTSSRHRVWQLEKMIKKIKEIAMGEFPLDN